MAQVTLYLDPDTEQKMKQAASEAGVSQSRWVADLIRSKTSETWPESVSSLVSSWNDVPLTEQLRASEGEDVPREPF